MIFDERGNKREKLDVECAYVREIVDFLVQIKESFKENIAPSQKVLIFWKQGIFVWLLQEFDSNGSETFNFLKWDTSLVSTEKWFMLR